MNTKVILIGLSGLLAAGFFILGAPFVSSDAPVEPYSSPEVVLLAIGPVESLPPDLQRAFTPARDFKPLPKPGPNDWLAINPEPRQTYRQFVQSNPNAPAPPRNVIYIQPLDAFAGREAGALENLKAFTEAFFQLSVVLQAPMDISRIRITERKNPQTGQRQLLTMDLLDFLRSDLPSDAYCRLGITTIDLYPEPSWNFVFGQAYLTERTGVYSFARYEPSFYGEASRSDDNALVVLRRFKVLAHETGHMFGIVHCTYLLCLMNGSNHLAEADASPVHLCPVCLRKLQHSLGFDIVQRYRQLELIYQQAGLMEEAGWVRKRADFVSGG